MILNLHEAGIDLNTERSEVNQTLKLDWTSIEKVKEDGNYLYLYYQESEALVIPKNNPGFTLTEENKLKRLIRDHLSIPTHHD